MRGEQRRDSTWSPESQGPSPRARGAAANRPPVATAGGTIPTCAGSSPSPRRRSCCAGDHPHVRGEQVLRRGGDQVARGPSPRARGAEIGDVADRVVLGTIPTCAGSSRGPRAAGGVDRDHPHVRGEQSTSLATWTFGRGPSPRARGAGSTRPPARRPRWTIPTCAGSRAGGSAAPARCWDHPHVRGEQNTAQSGLTPAQGPSPRARGAANGHSPHTCTDGTIPTCAGSRLYRQCTMLWWRDHPHVRGEQPAPGRLEDSALGPSPRARGAVPLLGGSLERDGTIPTCAGSRMTC